MIDPTHDPGELSALARELLEKLGVRREAAWTAPREELRRELAAMGWPCSEGVLRAEEAAGGLTCWLASAFGLHASLRFLRGEVPWDRDDLQDYSLREDPRDPSKKLLPLWIHDDPWIWLALDGRVFYGSHIDGRDYYTPAFEDVVHHWEVFALLDARVVESSCPLLAPRPRLESSSLAGAAIARELGLALFGPGTRGATRAWTGPGARAVELDIPGFKRGTDVVSDSAEGVVLATEQALDAGGAARITVPEALDDDLLAALPVPDLYELTMSHQHVYTWGKYTDYADDRYRRRHRESVLSEDTGGARRRSR